MKLTKLDKILLVVAGVLLVANIIAISILLT